MQKMKFALSTGIAFGLMLGAAHAATVTFNNLGGNNKDIFTSYTENGFTVTNTDGQFFVGTNFGNPVPDIFAGPLFGPATDSITVTSSSGLFAFSSLDLSANSGGLEYTVTGSAGGSQVYTYSSGFAKSNAFLSVSSLNSAKVDTLKITLDVGGTSANIDNLSFNVSSVPLPASAPMFGAALMALGAVGYGMKRKAKAAA
ncbi:hypothetical protein [Lichenifustis flavocetrariae]|uniref:VPLPA-CTERM sorting domain-containing protein n=1 Tax=Lichenifustis flavocetrariae TaxID=2949735 RepID=A0AA41Z2Q5_9HYPH|nr:hypothetical protein [Lichenifustis flavocetrariae]MCW6512639.1 VPLPA-CTERM sorting domain-containing protein [Lichenifustis flavocetrariae]